MSDIERLTDSEIVAAYVAGDRGAFAAIYDRYASRIFSYTLTMLRDRSAAADAAHDTFMTAARRMGELDDPRELRPWLFAIARQATPAPAREQTRTTPGPSHAAAGDADLAKGPRQADLQELVWAAADGLGERDRQLLALHLTEGLEGDDLARAMGVGTSHIQMMVSRMKSRVEKALGTLLLARLGSEDCDEFQAMVGNGDRAVSPEVRARIHQHVEGCEICQQRRALLLQPANVLPGIMVVPAPPALRPRVLDKVDRGDLLTTPPAARRQRGATPEWAKLGLFALVTLVVGVIGFAVSAQFEPIDPPASVPGSVPPAAAAGTTSTTTTAAAGPTTTRAGETTTSSTVADEPTAIEVSTESIDFGDEGIAGEFDLRNTGGRPGQWQLASSTDAVAPSAGGGELARGETVTIELSLDREEIEEGDISETVTITWEGGELVVSITGTHEANPIIHDPQASPSSVEVSGDDECQNTQTTISARIRDNSPLESVVVQWSPDGGGQEETEMVPVGNDMFEAVIGPFTTAQSTGVRIVAFDDRGNAGGATAPLTVVECP